MLWRAFFVSAVLSRCPLSRGVVERPTKGGNAFSFASAATNARPGAAASGLDGLRVAPYSSVSRLFPE